MSEDTDKVKSRKMATRHDRVCSSKTNHREMTFPGSQLSKKQVSPRRFHSELSRSHSELSRSHSELSRSHTRN